MFLHVRTASSGAPVSVEGGKGDRKGGETSWGGGSSGEGGGRRGRERDRICGEKKNKAMEEEG